MYYLTKLLILFILSNLVNSHVLIDLKHCKYVQVNKKELELELNRICKVEFLKRSRRQTTEDNINPVTKIFVDSLVNTIKPSLGTQAIFLEAMKPLLVSVGTGIIKELMKFAKNILDQGPFIDSKAFMEYTYEAYPVFIPSYGAFVLLSKTGTIDLMKQKLDIIENDKENLGKSNCVTNCTIFNSENINFTQKTTSEDVSKSKAFGDENTSKNFYIGEAHLIPIAGKTDSFESSRQVEDAYKNGNGSKPVKEYIKKIMDTKINIKSFKKRLLLSLVKKIEKAIRDL